jgi:hypothetical protein
MRREILKFKENIFFSFFQTPAIKEIDLHDFQKIMNNRLFDFWLVKFLI